MIKNLPQFVKDQVLQIFYNPSINDELTPGFIVDLINLFSTEKKWHDLTDQKKWTKVQSCLDKLEEKQELTSRIIFVKKRYFKDDYMVPVLLKKVRAYKLKNN